MGWKLLEPTETHLTLIIVSGFLIAYSLFSSFIRNRLHLSEPPLATLVGILFGPLGANILRPADWAIGDNFTQEFTRIVLGIQCFSIGTELPRTFFRSHWTSIAMLLGPVMAAGWLICALFIHLLFDTGLPTSLIISACLTPTDPILAASILSDSRFSARIPARIKQLLSAESGCNDGASFPFLYVGIAVLAGNSFLDILQRYVLITLLWQCIVGILIGGALGTLAHRVLDYSTRNSLVGAAPNVVFYLFVALFGIGIASALGVDDFLVAFAAGLAFAHNHNNDSSVVIPFHSPEDSKFPGIIDLQLNAAVFIFFGACIPWSAFNGGLYSEWPLLNPGRLFALVVLVLFLRRLPPILLLKPLIPDLRTWTEALFAGHFGPMGVGALFLAIEARAQLETDTSLPLPKPPRMGDGDLSEPSRKAVDLVWPVVCAVVLGSVVVHGLSTLVISVAGSLWRKEEERAPLLGGEGERFAGMVGNVDEAEEDET